MHVEKFLPDEAATVLLGQQMAWLLAEQTRAYIYLQGQLGAGKTSLARSFIHALGYSGKVKSPTYSLIEPYPIGNRLIYHFDFYRINDPRELEVMGVEEYFAQDAICLVEWPDLAVNILPSPDLHLSFSLMNEGRLLKIENHSDRGKLWLQRLADTL